MVQHVVVLTELLALSIGSHPWMILGWPSDYGVCGYLIRAASPGYRWSSIDDPWMAKVSMVYGVTLTELLAPCVGGHPWMIPGWPK